MGHPASGSHRTPGRRTAIALTSPAASLSPLSSRWASALCLLAVGEPRSARVSRPRRFAGPQVSPESRETCGRPSAGSRGPRTAPPWSAAARRSPPFIWNSDPRSSRSAAMSADRRISLFGSSTSSFQMDGGRCRATALQGRQTAIGPNSPAASLSPLSSRWASALCLLAVGEPMGVSPRTIRSHH